VPVFLKKEFVDYHKSSLSTPYLMSLELAGACNFGCLKIIDDTWKKTIFPPICFIILFAHCKAATKQESYSFCLMK